MSFNKNRLWVALALVLLLAASRAQAQDSTTFSKSFPDGSRVYLRESSWTERRVRTSGGGPEGVAASEKELRVDAYSLWLKRPGQSEDVAIWKTEVISDATDQARFLVSDVILKGDRAYVINQVRGVYGVDNVKRDTDGVWFRSSTTNLARHLEFQPIFKAEFVPKSKPQIFIEFKASGGKYDGQIRRWFWSLNGECWNRK